MRSTILHCVLDLSRTLLALTSYRSETAMNEATFERSQGIVPDAALAADRDERIDRLLGYANLAQSMAHDCSVLMRILQNAIDHGSAIDQELISGYGQGAIQRFIANAMTLVANEGERVLSDFAPADRD